MRAERKRTTALPAHTCHRYLHTMAAPQPKTAEQRGQSEHGQTLRTLNNYCLILLGHPGKWPRFLEIRTEYLGGKYQDGSKLLKKIVKANMAKH